MLPVVEIIFMFFCLAVSITSCSSVTPSAKIMQEVSAKDATAKILRLDIMVIHASPLSALPITQLKRSPIYTPEISRSGSESITGVKNSLSAKFLTVIFYPRPLSTYAVLSNNLQVSPVLSQHPLQMRGN